MGGMEFGSPKLPMFREALMLHYLDDLDSKMAAVRAALESDKGEGNWTAYNGALDRRILRTDLFRRESVESETNRASVSPLDDQSKSTRGQK